MCLILFSYVVDRKSWLSGSGLILCAWYLAWLANGWCERRCELLNSGFLEAFSDIVIVLCLLLVLYLIDLQAWWWRKMNGKWRKMAKNIGIFLDLLPIFWILFQVFWNRDKVGRITWYVLKPGYVCIILGSHSVGWGSWPSNSGLNLCVWHHHWQSWLANGWGGS